MNHRIQRFTVDGEYLGGWGSYGAQAGQFNTPWRLACDADGNVFVADWRNDRVQAFTPRRPASSASGECPETERAN